MSEDPECQELVDTNEALFKARAWIQDVGTVGLLIAWIVVVTLLITRGQLWQLAKSIKISLLLYLLQLITELSLLITRFVRKQRLEQCKALVFMNGTPYYRIPFALLYTFFAINHWIFCWHYFQAACLFKSTFGQHSFESLERLEKRKKNFRIVNIIFIVDTCLICGSFILIFVIEDAGESLMNDTKFDRFLEYAGSTYLLILSIMSVFSISHIQQSAKKLEQIGIFANKILFSLYAFSWSMTFIGFTSSAILGHISSDVQNQEPEKAQNLTTASNSFAIVSTVGVLCLNVTILLTYLKFSNKLSSRLEEIASDQLRTSFSNHDHSTEQERLRLQSEQQSANRQFENFQEIANHQITQALATMMTVSQLKMGDAIEMDFDMDFSEKESKSGRAGVTESFAGTQKVSTTDCRDSESVFRSAHQQ